MSGPMARGWCHRDVSCYSQLKPQSFRGDNNILKILSAVIANNSLKATKNVIGTGADGAMP